MSDQSAETELSAKKSADEAEREELIRRMLVRILARDAAREAFARQLAVQRQDRPCEENCRSLIRLASKQQEQTSN
jgi:hypothetical protein